MVYWYWFDYIYYTLLEYIVVTGQDVVHMANIIIMTFYDIGHDTYVVSGLSPLSPSTIIKKIIKIIITVQLSFFTDFSSTLVGQCLEKPRMLLNIYGYGEFIASLRFVLEPSTKAVFIFL